MPFYEYQCTNCNHKFEELQKLSDKPLLECPECKKKKLERIISAGGFRIQGAGVYKPTSKLD